MPLTHYVIVRRDLPIGAILAQVTHAAGESFGLGSSVKERGPYTSEVGGLSPSRGSTFDHTIAVVLGVRNERKLLKLERKLVKLHVQHVAIREPDEPYNGQLMAIGLAPLDRELVRPLLKDYQPFPNTMIIFSPTPSPIN